MRRSSKRLLLLFSMSSILFCFFFGAVSAQNAVVQSNQSVIIRSADIILKVPDYQAARSRVLEFARKYEAELREAQSEVDISGQRYGDLTLRLESSRLDALMDDLHRIGKLYSERVQTLDQTSYYDTLKRRSEILRQNEAELQDFLRRPKRMRGSDILFVQYRLFQTRVQASDALQARSDLARGTRRSLLHVELFEPEPKQVLDWRNWHSHATFRAKGAFLTVVRKLMTGGYFLLYFAVFWIPLGIIIYIAGTRTERAIRRRLAQRKEESEPKY